jgi:hypothetical protein
MIPPYSPQARGRSERNFGTWQGRLPQELRLRGIHSLDVDRVGQLLLSGANQRSLRCGRYARPPEAASVAMRDKHHEPRPGYLRFPEASLHSVFGLVQLPHGTTSLEPDAGNLPVRFDERVVSRRREIVLLYER